MNAISVDPSGDAPRMTWGPTRDPEPGPGEVLVEVRAAGVNRADLLQARGRYPVPPGTTAILGLELAGVVLSVPKGLSDVVVGDRVCALVPGGAYAELAAVDHRMLIPIPPEWDFPLAAGIPEAWLTAYVNLFIEGQLKKEESVLIHAGASGVGTAAIQLAREAGARVLSTAGTAAKCHVCEQLGARPAINYKTDAWDGLVVEATDGGVDVILDPVGADNLRRNLSVLGQYGRLVCIGLLSGATATIDLGAVLGKSLVIRGSRLRPRPLEEKIRITQSFRDQFWPGLLEGRLTPIIDSQFPMADAERAHRYVGENRNTGKVILVRSG